MRCNHYKGREQCPDEADYRLYPPGPWPNPVGFYCRKHLEAIILEYADKLDEHWYGVEVDDLGNQASCPVMLFPKEEKAEADFVEVWQAVFGKRL